MLAVKRCAPPATPDPVFVDEAAGAIAYPKLSGTPMIATTALATGPLSRAIGPFLSRLHSMRLDEFHEVVPREESPMAHWLADAREKFSAIVAKVPVTHRLAVSAFVHSEPPADESIATLCHNDLGIEHILTDGQSVTGIIDWSDAAITDPARDFALLYRDLGQTFLDAILACYVNSAHDVWAIRARAAFYARCSAIDDIEYGLRTGRAEYAEKSLAALEWLFPS